jgi:hypothetical protein
MTEPGPRSKRVLTQRGPRRGPRATTRLRRPDQTHHDPGQTHHDPGQTHHDPGQTHHDPGQGTGYSRGGRVPWHSRLGRSCAVVACREPRNGGCQIAVHRSAGCPQATSGPPIWGLTSIPWKRAVARVGPSPRQSRVTAGRSASERLLVESVDPPSRRVGRAYARDLCAAPDRKRRQSTGRIALIGRPELEKHDFARALRVGRGSACRRFWIARVGWVEGGAL